MDYKNAILEDILKVELSGDILGDSKELELIDSINTKINDSVLKCLLDLSEVRYVNSSGIGVLITILTKFRNHGGEAILVNPSDQIKKLLKITKLDSVFTIEETEAEAIKKFN